MFSEIVGSSAAAAAFEVDSQEAMASDAASVCSKREAEEMEEGVIERTCIDITALDMDKLVVKPRSFRKTPLLSIRHDGLQVFINLTPEDDTWLKMPFGFDRLGKFVSPDMTICGGKGFKNKDGKDVSYETLDARIVLEDSQAEILQKLEKTILEEAKKHHPGKEWKPSLGCLMDGSLCLEASIIAKTGHEEDGGTTMFMVKLPGREEPLVGRGVEFLRPLLDKFRDFAGAEVKATVTLKKGWVNETKVGLDWTVDSMMVKLPPKLKTSWPAAFKADLFKKK
jgi:hypothetical protein